MEGDTSLDMGMCRSGLQKGEEDKRGRRRREKKITGEETTVSQGVVFKEVYSSLWDSPSTW